MLGVIALYSPKRTHDELFISNYATINLVDDLRSTAGVGDAKLFGPQDYAIRVWLQTDRLTGLGLTSADIIKAVKSQNMQAAVGRIGARPISDDQQLQLNIQTKGRLSSIEDFEKIIIRPEHDRGPQNRRGGKCRTHPRFAHGLGLGVLGMGFAIGADRRDMHQPGTDRGGGLGDGGGACALHGVEFLCPGLGQDADQVDDDVGLAHRRSDRLRVAHIGLDGFDLPDPPERPQKAGELRPAHGDADEVATVGERAHHMAAEESLAAEHGDERLKP